MTDKYFTSQPIIEFGDSHCPPDGISDELQDIILLAEKEGAILVGNGDIADFLPYGLSSFINSKFQSELIEALGGKEFYYITGNHDPYNWVKKIFGKYSNIKILKQLNLFSLQGNFGLHFRHGHEWSPDWFFLRYFAPTIVDLMVDHFPSYWYSFSKRMGWMPSSLKAEGRNDEYLLSTLSVWYKALTYAKHKGCRVIVGHTHNTGLFETWIADGLDFIDGGPDNIFADPGALKDKIFLRIGRTIEFDCL